MTSKAISILAVSLILCFVLPCSFGKEKKYHVIQEKLNWFEAYHSCQSKEMDLASVESQKEKKQIIKLLEKVNPKQGTNNGFWLSGHRIKKSSEEWTWVSTLNEIKKFTMWAPNEPNNQGGNERCMEMFKDKFTSKWFWNDVACSEDGVAKGFVCQEH